MRSGLALDASKTNAKHRTMGEARARTEPTVERRARQPKRPPARCTPSAKLHWLDTADHGYRVQKRQRTSAEGVFDEMGRAARAFIDAQGT